VLFASFPQGLQHQLNQFGAAFLIWNQNF